MADEDARDGYPDSSPEDLTPPGAPLSLDDADREAETEDLVEPQGAPPPNDLEREDAFSDAPDVDVLSALEVGDQGSRPEDVANFEDNSAEWSRQKP